MCRCLMPNERSLWRISPGQDRGSNDARSRGNLFSKGEKRAGASLGRQVSTHRDIRTRQFINVPLAREGARERRCGSGLFLTSPVSS